MLGLLCLVVAMACDIPQSITVTGKPEVYLPLGNPFSKLEEGERLEDYIKPSKIKEMMNAASQDPTGFVDQTKIYDYQPPGSGAGDPQTYIVHYPIVEMQYDLTTYVKNALDSVGNLPWSTIPPVVASLPSPTPWNNVYLTPGGISNTGGTPLFTVRLADMYKLIISVDGDPPTSQAKFGIQLDWTQAFEDSLRLYIPAFEIGIPGTYLKGDKVSTPEGDKLQFVNPGKTKFEPREDLSSPDGDLEIYVQVLGPCSGTIKPQEIFVWKTAKVDISDTNGHELSGQYKIENSMKDVLGDDISFKEISAYIYVNGIDGAELSLKSGNDNLIYPADPNKKADLVKRDRPGFPLDGGTFTATLPPHSIADVSSIDLTEKLKEDSLMLDYNIVVETILITNDDDDDTFKTEMITVDMVVLIPLEFILTEASSESGYIKFDLKNADGNSLFPEPGEDDLFGRSGDGDDFFSNINSVTILVRKLRNTIIGNDNVFVLIKSDKDPSTPFLRMFEIDLTRPESKEMILYADLPNPFTPSFELILPKDPGQNHATLWIRRQAAGVTPVFDFLFAVEARTDLNIKL